MPWRPFHARPDLPMRSLAPGRAAPRPGLAAAEKAPGARLDRYGDPLPPGAVARLGSLRLVVAAGAYAADAVTFSPDGKLLASGGGDTPVSLWDVSTGREVRQLRGHEKEFDPSQYHNLSHA